MRNPPLPPPRLWPLVLAAALGFAVLLALGFWQLERLEWKRGLLAELDAKAAAEPVDLATAERRAAAGENVEFLKLRFRGHFLHESWMKMISTYEGGQGWTIITPALTADGRAVIVDRGRVPGQLLESFERPPGELELTGVIRTHAGGRTYFDPDNDPAANAWFWWDIPAMLAAGALPEGARAMPFAVQLLPEPGAPAFPRPAEPRANLRNNHLGYALTWFGLAAALVAVTAFYIRTLITARNA